MSFTQELSSWFAPKGPTIGELPSIGSKAPDSPRLQLGQGKEAIVTFLRHCGCPFAEKTFLNFLSHSDQAATDAWLRSLPQSGSEPDNLRIVVDDKVEIYAAWGLGTSKYAHFLSPSSLYQVWRLGNEENIWNRPTESGSRWQTSGFFAVDGDGIVKWGRAAERADDVPHFRNAVETLEGDKAGEMRL